MNAPTKAVFSFSNYRIVEFFLRDYENQGLNAHFDPHGTYNPGKGEFQMMLDFTAFIGNAGDEPLVAAKLLATFLFEDDIPSTREEIPPYFYANAIAIVFPYLRAFISTLTIQANRRPLIMPLFNLTDLEAKFRAQTSIETAPVEE